MKAPATVTVPVKVWAQVGDAAPVVVAAFDWSASLTLGEAEHHGDHITIPLVVSSRRDSRQGNRGHP